MKTYKNTALPPEFTEGYELCERIDQKIGRENLKKQESANVEMVEVQTKMQDITGRLIVETDVENTPIHVKEDELYKIRKNFKNGQEYNTEHIKIVMLYKLVRALFWIGFWVGLVQERVWKANINMIFPDYETKGCPSYMNAFWADVCLGFIFELELTILHTAFFACILYVDNFSIKRRYGFLKMNRLQFFLYFILKNPLFELIRTCALTLICLAVYQFGLKKLQILIFLAILLTTVTLVVIADVAVYTKLRSTLSGKLTPLEQKDPALVHMINDEWSKRG